MIRVIKNNLVLKILSLILAVIVWIVIINISNPTETRQIKNIKVTAINDNLIYNNDKSYAFENNGVIDVKVYGRKTIVSNLTDKDFIAIADLSKLSITNAVEVSIKFKDSNIDANIVNSKKILKVSIENILDSKFPISVKTKGNPKNGLDIGKIESNPAEVGIRAPESLIKSIKEIVAEVDIKDATEEVIKYVNLKAYDENGNEVKSPTFSINKDKVIAKVYIYPIKNMPIKLEKLPSPQQGYAIEDVIINPANLDIVAPKEKLKQLNFVPINYDVDIFGELTNENIVKSVDILDVLPNYMSLHGDQKKINVQIKVAKKAEKFIKLRTDDIAIENISADRKYKFESSTKMIRLSGAITKLDKLISPKELEPYIDTNSIGDDGYVEIKFKKLGNLEVYDNMIKVRVSKG